jgi:quercetin dioxygenase-like cupin family protein
MADRYPDDDALEKAGRAAGMAVWDVIAGTYGDILGDGQLATAQLESLRRAILAEAATAPGGTAQLELGQFTDERGRIQDLLGHADAVTEIITRAGAVRGNHVHKLTTQWTYVVSGQLQVAWLEDDGVHTRDAQACDFIREPAGIPHAWKAVTDCIVLVLTRGPRAATEYERDTIRLDVPILT